MPKDRSQDTQSDIAEIVTQLEKRYGVQLERYLARRLGSRALAQEVAQEALLTVFRRWNPNVYDAKATLFFYANHLSTKCLAKERRFVPAEEDERPTQPDPSLGPEGIVRLLEFRSQLQQIISALPPRQQQVMAMRFLHDMPTDEIASELGISRGAVEQALTKARRACVSKLEKQGFDRRALLLWGPGVVND